MKKGLLVLITVMVFSASGCTSSKDAISSPQSDSGGVYEYQVVDQDGMGGNRAPIIEKFINEKAQEGWEYVGTIQVVDSPNVVFRKEK